MGNPIYLGTQYASEVLNTTGVNLTALTDDELGYINGEHLLKMHFTAFGNEWQDRSPGSDLHVAAESNGPS